METDDWTNEGIAELARELVAEPESSDPNRKLAVQFARLFLDARAAARGPVPGETCCYGCFAEPVAQGGYCAECNARQRTTLECCVCGAYPATAGIIPLDAQPGDQCPCCYIHDMDCDGVLVDAAM